MGAADCGKSTVVQKGLKAYGLSEPVVATIPPEMGDGDGKPVTCTLNYRIWPSALG